VAGWKGHTSTTRYILREITDTFVTNARTDIMVVKLVEKALPKRLLLPTHGGVHAEQAQNYAADIAASQNGTVTLCALVPPDAQDELIQSENERLRAARDRIVGTTTFDRVETIVVQNRSVTDGMVAELENHDGVIVGAAGKSFPNRILFESIPEEVARLSDKPVIVVKRHHTVKALFGRVISE
jgi:nucleotide-binding universal stress UspA family protein